MIDFLIILVTVFFKYLTLASYRCPPWILYSMLGAVCALCVLKVLYIIRGQARPYVLAVTKQFFLILFFVLFMTLLSRDANYILPFLLAFNFSYNRPGVLASHFFWSSVGCYALHLFLYATGLIQSHNMIRIRDDLLLIRRSLGFDHPNNGFLFFLPIVLGGFLVFRTKWPRRLFTLFVAAASLVLYHQTNTRSGLVIILLVTVLFQFKPRALFRFRWVRACVLHLFALMLGLSLLLAGVGANPDNALNRLFTGRPHIWYAYLTRSVRLIAFGSPELVLTRYGGSIDNYFLFGLVSFGVVYTLILCFLYFRMFKVLLYFNRYEYILVSFAYLLYGMTENNTIIASLNFTLIYLYMVHINKSYFAVADPLPVPRRRRRRRKPFFGWKRGIPIG